MQYGIYKSAAGALAAETKLDTVANNLANVDTVGFKRRHAVFQQRLTEAMEQRFEPSRTRTLDQLGGGLFVHEITFSPETGSMMPSKGNDLHVALEGDGWFTVSRGGETLYTRAGNFARNEEGRLVTADGQAEVLDDRGQTIDIPTGGNLLIDHAGNILANDELVASLGLKGTLDHRQYIPLGDNLFRHVGDGTPDTATPTVRHQTLEQSTVSPVREMVAMIRTFRAYESNQRSITQQDESFGRAVNDVGRLPG